MNLTTCSASCRWQKDGLCTLPPDAPQGVKAEGCCYFSAPEGTAGEYPQGHVSR